MEGHFSNIEKIVRQSVNYWQGDAGEAHRSVYAEYTREIQDLLETFQKTAGTLESMAANYRTGESEAEREAEGLPSDVIV